MKSSKISIVSMTTHLASLAGISLSHFAKFVDTDYKYYGLPIYNFFFVRYFIRKITFASEV